LDLGSFFSFLIFFTDDRIPWAGDQPVARQLPAHRTAQTQNKRTHTSTPQVAFEPTILVFERAKTVHALDGAAIVIGQEYIYLQWNQYKGKLSRLKYVKYGKNKNEGKFSLYLRSIIKASLKVKTDSLLIEYLNLKGYVSFKNFQLTNFRFYTF
jgi:hypothetical protein